MSLKILCLSLQRIGHFSNIHRSCTLWIKRRRNNCLINQSCQWQVNLGNKGFFQELNKMSTNKWSASSNNWKKIMQWWESRLITTFIRIKLLPKSLNSSKLFNKITWIKSKMRRKFQKLRKKYHNSSTKSKKSKINMHTLYYSMKGSTFS